MEQTKKFSKAVRQRNDGLELGGRKIQPRKTHNSLNLSVGGLSSPAPVSVVLTNPEVEAAAATGPSSTAEAESIDSPSTAPKTSPLLNLFASPSNPASSLKELPSPLPCSKRLPSPEPPKVALLLNFLPTLCTNPEEKAAELGLFLTRLDLGTESNPSLSWVSSGSATGNPIFSA
jgi:hypothetical protein